MRPARPIAVRSRATLAVAVLAAAACQQPQELRAEVIRLDRQWRFETMEEGSFERMVEAVRGLGAQHPLGDERLVTIPDLLRLVLHNPSSLVRAEALRAAWELGAALPAEPWRVDELDRDEFTARVDRLDELLADGGEAAEGMTGAEAPTGAPTGAEAEAEAVELARWLGRFHIPPGRDEELRVAVSLAEVAATRALWRADPVGDVFREHVASSLHHALALCTLHAAADPYAVVREEALASARHLHPELALRLVEGVIEREGDSAVLLAALDSLSGQPGRWEAEALGRVLGPLARSNDVAIRRRVQALLAAGAGA